MSSQPAYALSHRSFPGGGADVHGAVLCAGDILKALKLMLRRSRTAVAPLERLKILMQVQGNDKVYTGVWQVSTRPSVG